MANYNNYYPYNPYYAQGYQSTAQQTQAPQPQIHNGGYVSVRSEDEALMYPVAPGNSVTFINELAPYQYKKTMGFSQFDKPIFEKFRVVREEPQNAQISTENKEVEYNTEYIKKDEIDALKSEIAALSDEYKKTVKEVNKLKSKLDDAEIKKILSEIRKDGEK